MISAKRCVSNPFPLYAEIFFRAVTVFNRSVVWLGTNKRWKTKQIEKFSQMWFLSLPCTHLLLFHCLFRLHWFLSFRYLHSLYWGGTRYTENAVNVDSNFHFDLCTLSRSLGNHILNQELACKVRCWHQQGKYREEKKQNKKNHTILPVEQAYICYREIKMLQTKQLVGFAVPIQTLGYGSSFRLS